MSNRIRLSKFRFTLLYMLKHIAQRAGEDQTIREAACGIHCGFGIQYLRHLHVHLRSGAA